jgi:hypothetical protein
MIVVVTSGENLKNTTDFTVETTQSELEWIKTGVLLFPKVCLVVLCG